MTFFELSSRFRLLLSAFGMADLDLVPVAGRTPTGVDVAVRRGLGLPRMVRAGERRHAGCRQYQLDRQRCYDLFHGDVPFFLCRRGVSSPAPPGKRPEFARSLRRQVCGLVPVGVGRIAALARAVPGPVIRRITVAGMVTALAVGADGGAGEHGDGGSRDDDLAKHCSSPLLFLSPAVLPATGGRNVTCRPRPIWALRSTE